MSNLQRSKRFNLTDKFNNTSRYLDDNFSPIYIQQNFISIKQILRTKKHLLNIKVIGNNIHTNVYDKRYDFDFI